MKQGPRQVTEYLPDASPEEQYRFALARALQNDLQTAENAFVEFSALHPEHERAVDALFWQGRVQFIQGQYEKAATTFSKFNSLYSSDPHVADTTLWIAESVAKFANPEQACAIMIISASLSTSRRKVLFPTSRTVSQCRLPQLKHSDQSS